MLKSYFNIALRSLWKSKVYASINIGGLALGMAASVMILLWVRDERSYDSFQPRADRIYRVITDWNLEGRPTRFPTTASPLAIFAQKDIPEVQYAVRCSDGMGDRLFTVGNKAANESKVALVDPAYFRMFEYRFVEGKPDKALPDTRSIVITQSVARKYFGDAPALGKLIRVDNDQNFMVTGVVQDNPANTSLPYDCFLSFQIFKEKGWDLEHDWGNYNYLTYLQLRPGASVADVEKKLVAISRKNHQESKDLFTLQPLKVIHLDTDLDGEENLHTLRIFSAVALIILLIACINYVNLSTARATKRAKEVGVRKIIGASRPQLFGQFLGESTIVLTLALVLAVALIEVLTPLYNEIAGKQLTVRLLDPQVLAVLLLTVLVTLAVAGVYPALLLSSFQPLKVIKGNFIAGSGNALFRRALVVAQFAMSIVLVIATLVIGKQLRYIQQKQLGYERENVFVVPVQGNIAQHLPSYKDELRRQPGVQGVTSAGQNILQIYSSSTGDWEGKDPGKTLQMHQLSVDPEFLGTFRIPIVAGRGFSQSKADSNAYVLNEEAIRQMGLKDPIGKMFTFHGVKGPIIGIAKDFHFKSVHERIEPFVFFQLPGWMNVVYVKTTGKDAATAIASAEKVWKAFNPAYPFEYTFLDETFDRMYRADQRTGKLFNCFAVITILISCLGLFGLATYTAETRTKEIGIRKVLGASVSNIVTMLSKDFLRLVMLSNLIAWPLGWWATRQWLEDFAYRIEPGWDAFLLAGVSALLIALLTVSFQAIRAALTNPTKSLRTE